MANECDTEFWEGISDIYSADDQGDTPQRIVDRLFDTGSVQESDCVLEIGSGPGTYSLLLAPRVRILVCMDSSNLGYANRVAPYEKVAEISKLMDFAGGGDVADPYYTGDFGKAYRDILRGCEGLLEHIRTQHPELGA